MHFQIDLSAESPEGDSAWQYGLFHCWKIIYETLIGHTSTPGPLRETRLRPKLTDQFGNRMHFISKFSNFQIFKLKNEFPRSKNLNGNKRFVARR